MTSTDGLNAAVRHLSKSVGYTFTNTQLLHQALTHRSAAKHHNERLEYLGDAVLGMVVAKYLYFNHPTVPEGKLTRMRATLVKGETLAQIATELSLGEWIKLGSGELKSGGHRRASILADAVEAIIGAIYLDSDIEHCENVILSLFKSRMESLDPNAHPKDPKTQLQEYLQGRKLPLPDYDVIDISGKDHAQIFTVTCKIKTDNTETQGVGPSRRRAEQNAAELMLQRIQQESRS